MTAQLHRTHTGDPVHPGQPVDPTTRRVLAPAVTIHPDGDGSTSRPPRRRPTRRRRHSTPPAVVTLGTWLAGPLVDALRHARDLCLTVLGFGLVAAAAAMIYPAAGVAVAGIAILYVQWLTSADDSAPEQPDEPGQ